MTHLGDKVSALVDGQLPIEATERAHAHLARCRDCRDSVEAERLMKARLSCLPSPAPGADLMGRLLALGGPSGPLPPRPGHVPGTPRPAPLSVSVPAREPEPVAAGALHRSAGAVRTAPPAMTQPVRTARPGGGPRSTRRPAGRPDAQRRRIRIAGAVLGALGVVGAGVSGLVMAAPSAPTVPVRAPMDSLVVERPLYRPTLQPDVSLRIEATTDSRSAGGR